MRNPSTPAAAARLRRLVVAGRFQRIEVAHQHDGRVVVAGAELAHEVEHLAERHPRGQRPFARPLDHRTVRHGIGERHPELDEVRTRLHHGVHHRHRRAGRRVAGGDERDERGPLPRRERRETGGYAAHRWIPSMAATVWMSLSPRPDRPTTMTSSGRIPAASFAAYASAWLDSSAGMMPSVRVHS